MKTDRRCKEEKLMPLGKKRTWAKFSKTGPHSVSWEPLAKSDLGVRKVCEIQRVQWILQSKFLTHNCGWIEELIRESSCDSKDCALWYRNTSFPLAAAVETDRSLCLKKTLFLYFFFLWLYIEQIGSYSLNNWLDILWDFIYVFANHSLASPPIPHISLLLPLTRRYSPESLISC